MHSDKETGFLAASTHHNQEFSKKPGFWPPAPPQRNRVFGRIYASQPRILEKTRFLAIRASSKKPHSRLLKETGFLAKSTHHNHEFSKKPGF
ncbi:MAG: hypothetical protein EAZ09_09795 [Oscillatoriales cyanobacterium]|nr:MAG: hypothetical protein EAZ09_09795 [Oscillatoriales cyanobacterium]